MEEIEVKILEINKKETVRKLKRLGAKKVSDGDTNAILFDFPNKKLKKAGKLLRLRTSGKKIELTLKKKISKKKTKIMKEHEVDLNDFEIARDILKGIGLKESKIYVKNRTSYKLGKVKFEFDTLPGIPTYLEIEAPTEKIIEKCVKKLGFSMSDTKPWNAKDILKYYKEK